MILEKTTMLCVYVSEHETLMNLRTNKQAKYIKKEKSKPPNGWTSQRTNERISDQNNERTNEQM